MSADPTTGKIDSGKRHDDGKHGEDGFFCGLKITHVIELILATVLVGVTIYQALLIASANQIAGDAATAAKDSVDLASDTAKKQLRAYVLPTKGEVKGLNGNGPLQVRVAVRNSGQTPAHQTSIKVDTWWEQIPRQPPIAGDLPTKEGMQVTLAAGEETYVDHLVKEPRRQELKSRKAILHAEGSVRYKDIYGVKHESSFHFVQGGEFDPSAQLMSLSEGGNDSD
ncbi:MAG: hypothetical protein WD669_01880 [Pirellulales bacterium]